MLCFSYVMHFNTHLCLLNENRTGISILLTNKCCFQIVLKLFLKLNRAGISILLIDKCCFQIVFSSYAQLTGNVLQWCARVYKVVNKLAYVTQLSVDYIETRFEVKPRLKTCYYRVNRVINTITRKEWSKFRNR